MKLPIPLLLYAASAGLFCLAGWTFYEMLPLWKEPQRQAATKRGQDDARDLLGRGKGQGPAYVDWQYARKDADWWRNLAAVNLIGKLPAPPEAPSKGTGGPPVSAEQEVRPLEDTIELVSLVYDGKAQGRGGDSHVIVRYKPAADVRPPEWYMRENAAPIGAAAGAAGPRDVAPNKPNGPRPTQLTSASGRPSTPAVVRPISAPPTSMIGREILQKLWVQDNGDPRRSSHLWPAFETIKLVRVSSDAQGAYFVRVPRPAPFGQLTPDVREESLMKTMANLPQDVLREMRRLQGRSDGVANAAAMESLVKYGTWVDVEETTLIGSVRHIGRKEELRFRASSDEMFEQFSMDTYVGSRGIRGLIVRSVDSQIASKFGVAAGEVLLEVNGRPVQNKAQAIQIGKADYKRGVRTFTTKWLANGALVERTYQAPDR